MEFETVKCMVSVSYVKRLLLTVSSLSYFWVIYIVKEGLITSSLPFVGFVEQCVGQLGIALLLMGVAILFGWGSLHLCRSFPKESLDVSTVESIETANDNYLVNYMGFFLIATDMEDYVTLILVFLLLFYLVLKSNVSYFNPAFLFFGYKFYIITTDSKTRIAYITKQTLKKPEDIASSSEEEDTQGKVSVRRINEYVFIQWKDKKTTY